jgi:hypothetical protein
MRQLLINELSRDETGKVKDFLQTNSRPGGLDGIYWLQLPAALLAAAQIGHESCGPFAFAIEAGEDFVSFELLVRSESNLHCDCTCYPTLEQRAYLLAFMDRLLQEQGIKA